MKKINLFILAVALAMPAVTWGGDKPAGKAQTKPAKAAAALTPVALAPEGKKNALPGGCWFTWKFDKKPQLGTSIVKLQTYSGDKKQKSSYEITGEFGMPSMRAHDSGPVKFQLNRRGDYLLPVNVVMTGEWELIIRIKDGGREIFAGKIDIDV